MNKVPTIDTVQGSLGSSTPDYSLVANALKTLVTHWENERETKEERWLELWAHYLSCEESQLHLRNRVAVIVGDVNDDWRHRIMTGKAYSIIETATAYLAGATFPNDAYLNVVPQEPGIREEAKVVRKWMMDKLSQANLPSKWEMHLRQQLITGFSCIALPWVIKKETRKRRELMSRTDAIGQHDYWGVKEYEHESYNNAKLEVLSCFDVFVDPYAEDMNDASLFRRIHKTLGEVVKDYKNGTYDILPITELLEAAKQSKSKDLGADSKKQSLASFAGLDYNPHERVSIQEFWGDLAVGDKIYENVCITLVNNKVARFAEIPYWCGKPFIVGVPVPIPTVAYGLGILEPVRGMLHENNILTNQRLDGQEILIDPTFLISPDGVADPDSVYTAPGHFIEVNDMNAVRQLQVNPSSLSLTYTEQQVLTQNIDEATGVSAYVGTQMGRNAERVTAQEVNAVREAGGNRLSSIHTHIENTQFLPFLEKWLYMAQQFITGDQQIAVQGEGNNTTNYVAFGPDVINKNYGLKVVGAAFLTREEKVIADILAYVNTIIQVPEWQAMVNWEELLVVVTQKFNLTDDVETLILRGMQAKQEAQQAAAEQEAQAAQAMQPGDAYADEAAKAFQSQGRAGVQDFAAMATELGPDAAVTARQGQLAGLKPEQIQQAIAQIQQRQQLQQG